MVEQRLGVLSRGRRAFEQAQGLREKWPCGRGTVDASAVSDADVDRGGRPSVRDVGEER